MLISPGGGGGGPPVEPANLKGRFCMKFFFLRASLAEIIS
jgi:hypothetical protein